MRLHPFTSMRPLLSLGLVALAALPAGLSAAAQPAVQAAQPEPVKVVWNATLGYFPATLRLPSPVATSVGFVCVYPDLGSVSLINPTTFSPSWTFRVESTPSQIVVGGGSVYVLTQWGRLYGINLLDGTVVFDSKGIQIDGADGSVRPAYASGVIAVSTGRGVVGLDAATGKEKWRTGTPGEVLLLLSGGGRVIVGHSSGVSAIDPVTGASIWNATLGAPVRAAAIVGSSVYAVTDGGTLGEIDAATGRVTRSLKLPTPDPAPGEIPSGPDILYVVTRRGRIYPVGVRSFRRLDIVYLEQSPVAQPEVSNYLMILWTLQGVLLGVPAVPSPVDVVFSHRVWARFASGVGYDPVSQVAMFYLSDGSLVALEVPLYTVRVLEYSLEEGRLTADLQLCAFPGSEGQVTLTAKDELGRQLLSDRLSVYGGGCFLRSVNFDVGSSKSVEFTLTGLGLQSPPTVVALAAQVQPKPPEQPGMVIAAPPTLVVGESAELSIAVTNGWRDGLAYVSIDCEDLEKVKSEEGYVAVGASRMFTVEVVPRRPGELRCRASLVIESEVVHSADFTLRVERGSIIEGSPQASPQSVREGGRFRVRVKLVNRYEEGATFTVDVSGPGVVGEAVQVGPLAAGEEKEVSVSARASGAGSKDLTVTVSVGSALVDSMTLPGAVTVVAPQPTTPPPATSPSPGAGLISKIPEPVLDYLPYLIAALVAGGVATILRRRGGPTPPERRLPRPPPSRPRLSEIREVPTPRVEAEERVRPAEEIVPRVRPPRPEEVERVERPREEVAPAAAPAPAPPPAPAPTPTPAPPVSAEELSSTISELRESLKRVVSQARELEGEGLVGVDERASVVDRRLARAEVLIDIGDLEEAQKVVREVEETVRTLENTVKQFREILLGKVWSNVEKRIATMLRVWGRAPASMLTMIPSELRVAALARFVKLHPEMKLELRGDELYSLEEGA